MTYTVFCTTRFEASHSWPAAPDPVAFLRDPHRHEFHVRVEVRVDHDDRDIEFIMLKREVDRFIAEDLGEVNFSCEMYADAIKAHVEDEYGRPARVEVSEDGENGAIVE